MQYNEMCQCLLKKRIPNRIEIKVPLFLGFLDILFYIGILFFGKNEGKWKKKAVKLAKGLIFSLIYNV